MPLPSPVLTWTTLSGVANRIKKPSQFLQSLVNIGEQTLPTETIEIGTIRGERDVAPFVRVGSEAIMVGGLGSEMYVVQAPNIRIKRPFTPSQLLFGRQPGTVVFPTEGTVIDAAEQLIARDIEYMNNMVLNAEEWMMAQALRGAISYSVADEEVFTITFGRSGSNTIDPTIHWNEVGHAPAVDIYGILSLAAENGDSITDAVMGSEAAAQFRVNAAIRAETALDANLNAGAINLAAQFRPDGAILMGVYSGIRFWAYPRKLRIAGVATDLIRPKYIEFLSPGASNWTRFYGAIPDMDALKGRVIQAKRFSKSWTNPDPSALMALLHSRPLIVPVNPNSTFSFKAVSG